MMESVLLIDDVLQPDNVAVQIANKYNEWRMKRADAEANWAEIRKYVYATDTTSTTNSTLPWKNKTTIPKLCQIRDNIYANYMSSLFPKRKWVIWEASNKDSNGRRKVDAIENYMQWVLDQPIVQAQFEKLLLDYIDNGNAIASAGWVDNRNLTEEGDQSGYVGPIPIRYSPYDIVFNPVVPDFQSTPKMVRSLVSLGEVKEMLERFTKTDPENRYYQDLWNYMKDVRSTVSNFAGEVKYKDEFYQIDGFDSFQGYLSSSYVELITYYGDLYIEESGEFHRNIMCIVVDRHRMLYGPETIPGYFGKPPIYHCGWRKRQDNLWAMGPLDNLVGMQYRIDHLENLKADVFDLIAFPPLAISGYVEDFEWGPFERIHMGDTGKVEVLAPDVQALNANLEIQVLEQKMEEMAGAPKEAMGFRTPGEKTAYEVQRLENAAARVFYNKILQFETQIVEPVLNAMLELARRNIDQTQIRVFNDEFDIATFKSLTRSDITGSGRIRPVAAKHFAEKAEQIQNLTNFFSSPLGQNPQVMVHFSGVKIAEMAEDILNVKQYGLVTPYVGISEAAEAQAMQNAAMEQTAMQSQTPTGLTPDDTDSDIPIQPQGPPVG
jgi:hypothetical protein